MNTDEHRWRFKGILEGSSLFLVVEPKGLTHGYAGWFPLLGYSRRNELVNSVSGARASRPLPANAGETPALRESGQLALMRLLCWSTPRQISNSRSLPASPFSGGGALYFRHDGAYWVVGQQAYGIPILVTFQPSEVSDSV
jgi:hypothetical protein